MRFLSQIAKNTNLGFKKCFSNFISVDEQKKINKNFELRRIRTNDMRFRIPIL